MKMSPYSDMVYSSFDSAVIYWCEEHVSTNIFKKTNKKCQEQKFPHNPIKPEQLKYSATIKPTVTCFTHWTS